MAIETYKLSDGSTRYKAVAYLEGNQKTTKRGFKTKKAAKKWIAEQQVLGAESTRPPITYGELVDQWLQQYKPTVKESTYHNAELEIQSSYIKLPRNRVLSSITTEDIQDLALYFTHNYTYYTLRYSRIKALFTYAVLEGYIKQNPFDRVKKPKQRKKGQQYEQWDAQNLKDFLDLCKQEKRPIKYVAFRVLAYTGMRDGELAALKWSDLDGNLLTIRRTMSRDYNNVPYISNETKTEGSTRTIALDDETLSILLDWKKICPPGERIFPITSTVLIGWMHRICRKHPDILPDSTPHKLRHLHCTILLDAKANVKDVQERLGHTNVQTTLNVYAHANKNKRIIADIFTEAIEKNGVG